MANGTVKLVVAMAVFVTVGVILLNPVISVVDANTGTTSVTNATFNADYNNSYDLQGYDIDQNSETVYGFNDTSGSYEVVTSPGNYSIDYSAGEISINSSSTIIQDGEEVKVSYDYQAAGSLATLVIGFIPLAIGLLIFVRVADPVQRMV